MTAPVIGTPSARSSEYAPGSATPLIAAIVPNVNGNSIPPFVFQKPFPQCARWIATAIWTVSAAATTGTNSPSAKATPPASSANADTHAQKAGGRIPIRVTPWVHPASPGPPQMPRTFCAPCAAITKPTTTRTRARARSVLMSHVPVMHLLLSQQPHDSFHNPCLAGGDSRHASYRATVRIDHVVIAVSDFEHSNAFYRDVVRAEIVQIDGRIAYRLGGQQL